MTRTKLEIKSREKLFKNPGKSFSEFLEVCFQNCTLHEGIFQFGLRAPHNTFGCEDSLDLWKYVVENPPDNLLDILEKNGLVLFDRNTGNYASLEEQVYFLNEVYNALRKACEMSIGNWEALNAYSIELASVIHARYSAWL